MDAVSQSFYIVVTGTHNETACDDTSLLDQPLSQTLRPERRTSTRCGIRYNKKSLLCISRGDRCPDVRHFYIWMSTHLTSGTHVQRVLTHEDGFWRQSLTTGNTKGAFIQKSLSYR
jgi:hypothetical protein